MQPKLLIYIAKAGLCYWGTIEIIYVENRTKEIYMNFVIYDTESISIIKHYDTERGAKAALTRALKSGSMRYMCSFGYGRMKADRVAKLAVASSHDFHTKIDYEVEVTPLMSETGKKVKIRKSAQGGCTDPSTERYWSM